MPSEISIAKLVTGELVIGSITLDEQGITPLRMERCLGIRIQSPQSVDEKGLKVGYYPMAPFSPSLPTITMQFIMFYDSHIPEDLLAQYIKMTTGIIIGADPPPDYKEVRR